MNLFLFPSITVFYSFCSFKCLFASDCSHSSYKRFHSPGPTAGSCCPHPNLQDLTNLELQRGLAIWQGLPCCSQHLLLEIAGCWAESFLCTRLALVLASQDNQYRAQSCRWMYPGAPPWTQQALPLLDSAWEPRSLGVACACPQLPASWAQRSGQCQLPGLLLGWLVSLR